MTHDNVKLIHIRGLGAFFALLESKSVAVCQVKLSGSAVVFRALRQIHQDIDSLFSNHQIYKKNNFSKQHVEFML